MQKIDPLSLREKLASGDEIALIDVREEGVFTQRHILLASVAPLSHLELRIGELVPRLSAPIVLCDAGEGLAERAAAVLDAMGYTDVAILDGGIDGWESAGYVLLSGMNVPSKAFGEFVEAQDGTPHIAAAKLNAMVEAGENLVIVDSRPYGEYHRMSIPGGVNMPGAELVYRIGELAPNPETTVVVNCSPSPTTSSTTRRGSGRTTSTRSTPSRSASPPSWRASWTPPPRSTGCWRIASATAPSPSPAWPGRASSPSSC